jgi:hypothetical protein
VQNDAGVLGTCGDGMCAAWEHCNDCVLDCGVCEGSTFAAIVVDPTRPRTGNASLTLDAMGRPHIVYTDDRDAVLYAWLEGERFRTEHVEIRAPRAALDIAVNGAGRPTIVHCDGTLGLAHRTATAWEIEVLGGMACDSDGLSIAYDDRGRLHIAFSQGLDLVYAVRNASGKWTVETVEFGRGPVSFGRNARFTLDSSASPHFVYTYDGEGLRYARSGPTGWVGESVLSTMNWARPAGIAWSSSGVSIGAVADTGVVLLRTIPGGRWVSEPLDSGDVHSVAVTVDARDQLHVLAGFSGGSAVYRHRRFDGWTRVDVAGGGRFSNNVDIAVDRRGRPHLLHRVGGDHRVAYATLEAR